MSGYTDGKNLSAALSPTSPGLSPGLSAGHVRLLNLLSQEIASAIAAAAEDMLPGKAVVSPLPVTAGPRSALREAAASQEEAEAQGIGVAFAATPYPFQGELHLDRTLAYALLEHSLGGGKLTAPPARPCTALEQRLLVKLAAPLLAAWEQRWRRFAPVHFSPLETAELSSRGQACLCPFQITIGEVEGRLCLSLPLPEAGPLLAQLTVEAWVSERSDQEVRPTEREGPLLSALQGSRVSVRAILGSRPIALREMLRLSAGDLVPLPGLDEDAVTVHIADRPKFLGKVRHHRGRLVVELLEQP